MIKITFPFDFAYGGVRVVSLESGDTLPDDDEAALFAVDEGIGEKFEVAEESTEALPLWPLKTDPAVYLKKNPDGKNADLARRILGQ